jgi:hypothetical protein
MDQDEYDDKTDDGDADDSDADDSDTDIRWESEGDEFMHPDDSELDNTE